MHVIVSLWFLPSARHNALLAGFFLKIHGNLFNDGKLFGNMPRFPVSCNHSQNHYIIFHEYVRSDCLIMPNRALSCLIIPNHAIAAKQEFLDSALDTTCLSFSLPRIPSFLLSSFVDLLFSPSSFSL